VITRVCEALVRDADGDLQSASWWISEVMFLGDVYVPMMEPSTANDQVAVRFFAATVP
jgi:hypothetical protein